MWSFLKNITHVKIKMLISKDKLLTTPDFLTVGTPNFSSL